MVPRFLCDAALVETNGGKTVLASHHRIHKRVPFQHCGLMTLFLYPDFNLSYGIMLSILLRKPPAAPLRLLCQWSKDF